MKAYYLFDYADYAEKPSLRKKRKSNLSN